MNVLKKILGEYSNYYIIVAVLLLIFISTSIIINSSSCSFINNKLSCDNSRVLKYQISTRDQLTIINVEDVVMINQKYDGKIDMLQNISISLHGNMTNIDLINLIDYLEYFLSNNYYDSEFPLSILYRDVYDLYSIDIKYFNFKVNSYEYNSGLTSVNTLIKKIMNNLKIKSTITEYDGDSIKDTVIINNVTIDNIFKKWY